MLEWQPRILWVTFYFSLSNSFFLSPSFPPCLYNNTTRAQGTAQKGQGQDYSLPEEMMLRVLPPLPLLPLFPLLILSFHFTAFSYNQLQVYIVYLGEHSGTKTTQEIQGDHHSLLLSVKNSEAEARESLLYSYKNSIDGFAALLSDEEATKFSEMAEVVSTFRSEGRWSPHTTRSWEFIGDEERLEDSERDRFRSRAKYGKNVIVGMVDSGLTLCLLYYRSQTAILSLEDCF